MWKHRGRFLKISLSRRSIIDFMYFSKKTSMNSVSAEKYLDLSTLIASRESSASHISWYAIFLKAFAKVSEDFPELRQHYFSFPWPYLFEYQATSCMLAMERIIEEQTMLVYLKIDKPQLCSLLTIDGLIKKAKDCDPKEVPSFRRFLKIAKLPFILRRAMWFLGLNLPNYRWHYLGTFGITGIGRGVRSLSVKSPLAVNFIFDMNSKSLSPMIRLYWDHRIFDGLIVIKILEKLEYYLNYDLAEELKNIVVDHSEL